MLSSTPRCNGNTGYRSRFYPAMAISPFLAVKNSIWSLYWKRSFSIRIVPDISQICSPPIPDTACGFKGTLFRCCTNTPSPAVHVIALRGRCSFVAQIPPPSPAIHILCLVNRESTLPGRCTTSSSEGSNANRYFGTKRIGRISLIGSPIYFLEHQLPAMHGH